LTMVSLAFVSTGAAWLPQPRPATRVARAPAVRLAASEPDTDRGVLIFGAATGTLVGSELHSVWAGIFDGQPTMGEPSRLDAPSFEPPTRLSAPDMPSISVPAMPTEMPNMPQMGTIPVPSLPKDMPSFSAPDLGGITPPDLSGLNLKTPDFSGITPPDLSGLNLKTPDFSGIKAPEVGGLLDGAASRLSSAVPGPVAPAHAALPPAGSLEVFHAAVEGSDTLANAGYLGDTHGTALNAAASLLDTTTALLADGPLDVLLGLGGGFWTPVVVGAVGAYGAKTLAARDDAAGSAMRFVGKYTDVASSKLLELAGQAATAAAAAAKKA